MRLRRFAVAAAVLLWLGDGCGRSAPSPTSAVAARSAAAPPAGVVTLSIVGTSDVHGHVLSQKGKGGLDVLAGYLTNLRAARAKDGGGVVLVDAGDLFQGTLESNLGEGKVVIERF